MSRISRMTLLRRLTLLLSLLACFSAIAAAQQEPALRSVTYHLKMSRPVSHLFEVTIEVDLNNDTKWLDFQMPKWSPGRYAVFDFAKNVQEFQATRFDCKRHGETGSALDCNVLPSPFTRLDDQTWR